MSDYNRRNRNRFSENDDFDWESFDRETASSSTLRDTDGEMLRRRRGASSQKPQYRSDRQNIEEYPLRERTSQQSQRQAPKRKRRKKKRLTQKQIVFRKRVRITILVVFLVSVVVLSGMFVGM